MAGVKGSNPFRPTFSSGFRNNTLKEPLFIASLRRYPNQAIPSIPFQTPAASDFCNAAKEDDSKDWHWIEFHNFLLQRMTYKTAEDRLRYAKQYGNVLETANASDLLHVPAR